MLPYSGQPRGKRPPNGHSKNSSKGKKEMERKMVRMGGQINQRNR
jgi:hypothetical protein